MLENFFLATSLMAVANDSNVLPEPALASEIMIWYMSDRMALTKSFCSLFIGLTDCRPRSASSKK